jgi:hypothetical protein
MRPAADPGFAAGDDTTIHEIAQRLMHATAIEPRRARLGAAVDQIAARLRDNPTCRRRQPYRAHATAGCATIEWSHDLTGEERVLFRRLRRSPTASLVPRRTPCWRRIARRRIVDLIARLVDKSLVVATGASARWTPSATTPTSASKHRARGGRRATLIGASACRRARSSRPAAASLRTLEESTTTRRGSPLPSRSAGSLRLATSLGASG